LIPAKPTEYVAPRTETEKRLAKIWSEVLYLERVGIHDHFMDLGGDSILAAQIVERICREGTGGQDSVQVRLIDFFAVPTIAGLAALIQDAQAGTGKTRPFLIEMQAGSDTPFFCVPGGVGRVWGLYDLAACFRGNMPFCAFDAKEPDEVDAGESGGALRLDGAGTHSIPSMAAAYIQEMKQRQPAGPYDLGGLCWGAQVALEMAHQLRAAGDEVRLLALFDPNAPDPANAQRAFRKDVRRRLRRVPSVSFREAAALLYGVFRDLERSVRAPLGLIHRAPAGRVRTKDGWQPYYESRKAIALRDKIIRQYTPVPYPGPLTVFLADRNTHGSNDARGLDWQPLAQGGYREIAVNGEHLTWTKQPEVEHLATALLDVLAEVRSGNKADPAASSQREHSDAN